jgi:hypothetical protein
VGPDENYARRIRKEGGKHVEAKSKALPATDPVDCSRRANPA